MYKGDPVRKRRQPLSRCAEGIHVLIDPDQAASLREPFGDVKGMSAAAQRSVDIDAVRADIEALQDLLQ